jgi:hypothetical protein
MSLIADVIVPIRDFFGPDGWNLILNIVGGAIAAVAAWAFGKLIIWLYAVRLRVVFGAEAAKDTYHVCYGALSHTGNPFTKPGNPNIKITVDSIAPVSELRAVKYISSTFSKIKGSALSVSSDGDLKSTIDVNVISLGQANLKSQECLNHESNTIIEFDGREIIVKLNREIVITPETGDFDYGIILKIHPSQFKNRTWIVCAGFAEWGTSGAAWYLGNKWKKIIGIGRHLSWNPYAWFGIQDQPFCVITRTKKGLDNSTELLFAIFRGRVISLKK